MKLNDLFAALGLRAAAKKYARRLGAQLTHDYGGGDDYTTPQILAAVRKLKLPERHVVIGYATFMLKEAFVKLNRSGADYDRLRALYHEFLPYRPTSEEGDAGAYHESGKGLNGGAFTS